MIPVRGFEAKKVAVFGLARTGLAAARALKAGGAEVVVWDENAAARAAAELALQFDKPVALGMTGPGMTREQAFDRIDNARNAVEAAVRMVRTLKEIGE